jgi:hypothetical protein
MAENLNGTGRPDRKTYVENRKRFPYEELQKLRGQWVAWSADGAQIVAHHDDLMEVARQVEAAGYSSEDVVLDLQPDGDYDTQL